MKVDRRQGDFHSSPFLCIAVKRIFLKDEYNSNSKYLYMRCDGKYGECLDLKKNLLQ